MSRAGDVAVLIGTRPEAVKLMPVVRALEAAGAPPAVYVTGQHRELLAPILADLALVPVEDMGVMQPNQALGDLSARLLIAVQELLRRRRPGTLVVQGDTTSAAMGALAAFYEDVRIAHVEAGLRTGKRRNPFPEEMNRRLVACVADLHFAPTPRARDNLLAENVPAETVHLVGNTVVDALFHARDRLVPGLPPDPATETLLRSPRALVLVTAHRRESFGADLLAIAAGLKRLAGAFAGRIEIVYPVHLNPNVDSVMRSALAGVPGVHLTPPLSYLRFLQLLLRARLVITDSGGVQEEASALGIPFLCARRASERLEAVEAGVGEIVGPDAEALFGAAARLLDDDAAHAGRAVPTRAFGDGRAAERIARILLGTRG
ncbi:MAG TPA: UDP-N-acetylglucosamine 2-epimerase (non-hydrolyzing) [Vicinamibacteria bacterium]